MGSIWIWDGSRKINGLDWNVMQEVVENVLTGHTHDGVDSREVNNPRLVILDEEIIDKDFVLQYLASINVILKPIKDYQHDFGTFDLRWKTIHARELSISYGQNQRYLWSAWDANELRLITYDGTTWRNPVVTFNKFGDMSFGLLQDVNLYRLGADILATDDAFDADSLKVGGTEVISPTLDLENVDVDAGLVTSGTVDIARLPIRAKRVTASTDGSGLLTVTFDTPFPDSCTSVVVTMEGADGNYVKLNGAPTKTGFVVRVLKGAHTHTTTTTNAHTGGGVVSQTAFGTRSFVTGVTFGTTGSTIVPIGLKASATAITWYSDTAFPTASVWVQTMGATTGATLYGSEHTHSGSGGYTTGSGYNSGGIVSQTAFTTTSVVTSVGAGNADVLPNTEITIDYIAIGA